MVDQDKKYGAVIPVDTSQLYRPSNNPDDKYGPKIAVPENDFFKPDTETIDTSEDSRFGPIVNVADEDIPTYLNKTTAGYSGKDLDPVERNKVEYERQKAIDDEIQSLNKELETSWDEYKKDLNPTESLTEKRLRNPDYKPWVEKKADIKQKIANLRTERTTITTNKTLKDNPQIKDEVEKSSVFSKDSNGLINNDFLGTTKKIGLPVYNRIEKEDLVDSFKKIKENKVKADESANNLKGLLSWDVLQTPKPIVDDAEKTEILGVLDQAYKDPWYSGTHMVVGTYDYNSKRARMTQLLKDYVDKKDWEPDQKKAKLKDYTKFMNLAMSVTPDNKLTMYGLKSLTESNQQEIKARYDEITAIKEQLYKELYPASDDNTNPIGKLTGNGPDARARYENLLAYQKRIDDEYDALKGAYEFTEKVLKIPEQKRGVRDIAKGLWRDNLASDILTLGFDEMKRDLKVAQITQKMNEGDGFYEPTWAEAKILEMYAVMQDAQSRGTEGIVHQAMSGVTNMLPYIATFAGTKVLTDVTKGVVRKGISTVADAALGSMKEPIVNSLTMKLGPTAAKVIGKESINFAKVTADYTSKALSAGIQTAFLPQYWKKNIAERYTPEFDVSMSEDLKDVIVNMDRNATNNFPKAIYKGALDAYFEIATEHGGKHLEAFAKIPGRAAKTLVGIKVPKAIMLDKFFQLKGYKSFAEGLDNFKVGVLGWHGFKEEYLEELANQFFVNTTTGDRPENFGAFMKDQLVTLLTIGTFGLPMNVGSSAVKYSRYGFIGNDVVYHRSFVNEVKDKDGNVIVPGKPATNIRLPKEFHDKLLQIYADGPLINGEAIDDLMENWQQGAKPEERLNKEQAKLVYEISLQQAQRAGRKMDTLNKIDQLESEITPAQEKAAAKKMTDADRKKVIDHNEKMYQQGEWKDLIDNDLMPIDRTGQYIEPTAEYLRTAYKVIQDKTDKLSERDNEGNFVNRNDAEKKDLKDLEDQLKAELSKPETSRDLYKVEQLEEAIAKSKRMMPEELLNAQMQLGVVKGHLTDMANKLGVGFNYLTNREKNDAIQKELAEGKELEGKADMITETKMLITLPDGRQVNAFLGSEAGIEETPEQYKKRRLLIADEIIKKKTPVKLQLVRKEDWNPDDKAHLKVFNDNTGEQEELPYGDKINVMVGGKFIAAVQITDYNERQAMEIKMQELQKLADEKWDDFFYKAGKKLGQAFGAEKHFTREEEIKLFDVLKSLAEAIAKSAHITAAKAINMIMELIDKSSRTEDEKQFIRNTLAKHEEDVQTWVEQKILADKGWAKEPEPLDFEKLAMETTEGVAVSASQKVDMHLKTFFPLWKQIAEVAGKTPDQAQREFYHISKHIDFKDVTNDNRYTNWLMSLRNGEVLRETMIDHLIKMKFTEAVSVFNFYQNAVIAKQVGFIITKDGEVRIELLNKSDLYSDFIDNFNRNIERQGISTIKNKVSKYRTERDKAFAHYRDESTTPQMRIDLKKEWFEKDLDFLQDITGIYRDTWRQYFVQQTHETSQFANIGDKTKTDFGTYDYLLENDTYRLPNLDRFGNPSYWFESDLIFNLMKNEKFRPDKNEQGEALTPSEYMTRFRKFFLEAADDGKSLSNLYKLSTALKQEDDIGTSGNNVKSDRFSSFLQFSDFIETTVNVHDSPVDNALIRYYKQSGKKMEVILLNGIHNRMITDSREGKIVDEMSSEDLWVSTLLIYGKGIDSYLHNVGQFSDKPTIYLVDSPKRTEFTDREKEGIINALGGHSNFNRIVRDIKINVLALNATLFKEHETGEKSHDGEFHEYDEFVQNFLFNHVINTNDSQQLFFGEFDSYKKWYNVKQQKPPSYIDLVKRAGSSNSPGYRLNENIEGGVGESFTFAVANEQMLPQLKVTESMNGMILMRGSFAGKAQVSMGDIYSKKKQFPILDSLKAVMSFKHRSTNMRELTKANIINIDVLAERLGDIMPIYKQLKEFMDKNGIDVLSMPSSSKLHSGTDIIDLFDKKGNIREDVVVDKAKHIEDRPSSTLYVQQDLRHLTIPKKTKMPSQFLTNMFTLANSGQIIGYVSELQRSGLSFLARKLGTDPKQKMKYLKENVNEYSQADLKDLLDRGLSIDDPGYRVLMHTIMSTAIGRNALDIPISRVTTQELPDAQGILKPLRKTKDGKHVLLPQIITGIKGAREEEVFKGTMENAIKHIEANFERYSDLIGDEGLMTWELEEENGTVIIPGEIVISTRVPADGLHSHTVARLKRNIDGVNFTMLDRISQEASGSDFDGDYRFNQTFFRGKDGKIMTDIETDEGVANEIMMLVVSEYTKPELFDSIIRAISTTDYDPIVAELREKSVQVTNRYNPEAYLQSRLNNMVGVVMKGIMTDHMTTFSLLSRYHIPVKKQLRLVFGDGTAKKVLSLDKFAEDKHGAMKAHLSNLLNMSFDNAKDPKIEMMGFNEITANMFVMSLIVNSQNSSEKFDNFQENYDKIWSSIKELTEYFTSPVVQRYTYYKRRQAGGLREISNDDIKKKLFAEAEDKESGFSKSDVENLLELGKASAELSDFRTLYRLTQEAPKTYSDYINARHIVRKVRTQKKEEEGKKNKIGMQYFNTAPLFYYNEATKRMEFVTELSIAEKVLVFAQDNVYNDLIEETFSGKQIFSYLLGILQRTDEDKQYLSKREINAFSNALNKVFNIRSLGTNKTYPKIKSDMFTLFAKLKDAKDDFKKFENNEFLNYVRFVDKQVKIGKDTKTVRSIAILPEYSYSRIPVPKLIEIRKAFDALPEEYKDMIAEYVGYEYGFLNSTTNGGFFNLFGTKYRIDLSKRMSEEKEKWLNDELTPLDKLRIARWMQRILANKTLRDNDTGLTFSSVIDYNSEPLIRYPVSTDALEALESINSDNAEERLNQYIKAVDVHNIDIGSLYNWTRNILDLSAEQLETPKLSLHIQPAIKKFGLKQFIEEQKGIVEKYFPDKSDASETPVRNLYPEDAFMDLMLSDDKGLQDHIYNYLQKKYPGLRLFKDRQTFYDYVNDNRKKMFIVDPRAIGHAFGNALFIDPESEAQVILFHEMSHIYWDHLPEDHPTKKKFRALYAGLGMDQDDTDEMIIRDIQGYGTNLATTYLESLFLGKFKELLKEFWHSVKQFFGVYSKQDLVHDLALDILRNKDKINLDTIDSEATIRNMITSNSSSMNSGFDKKKFQFYIGNTIVSGITSIIRKFQTNHFNPDVTLQQSLDKWVTEYKQKNGIEPTPNMIVDEMDDIKLKWDESAEAGSNIHAVAECVFMNKDIDDTYPELAKRFTSRKALDEYKKSLEKLKKEILDKYPNATFYCETPLISTKYMAGAIADLIVDIGDHKLIVFDFKTTDKEYKDKNNDQTEFYTRNFGPMRHPVGLKQSHNNEHALQLSMEGLILEEQDNKLMPGEKNKIEGLFIVPVMREVDENGLISKARISNIVETPGGGGTSSALTNSIEHHYYQNEAQKIFESYSESFRDIEKDFPDYNQRFIELKVPAPIRKDLLAAIHWFHTISGTPTADITQKTLAEIQNNGMELRYHQMLDLGFDMKDIRDIPYEAQLYITSKSIDKRSWLLGQDNKTKGVFYRDTTVEYDTKRIRNKDYPASMSNVTHYHININKQDIYSHEAGTSTVKPGQQIVEIYVTKGAKKNRYDYRVYKVKQVNKKYKWIKVENENGISKKIFQVEPNEGVLIYDEKPLAEHSNIPKNNFIPRFIPARIPIVEMHWHFPPEMAEKYRNSVEKIHKFFREHNTKEKVEKFIENINDVNDVFNSLSDDDVSRPFIQFLQEVAVNHFMAEQLRQEHRFMVNKNGKKVPGSMMPITLNLYYMFTDPDKKMIDFGGYWKGAYYWQPARMMSSEYVPFNFLMTGLRNLFLETDREQRNLRKRMERFIELAEKDPHGTEFDIDNCTSSATGEKVWRSPSSRGLTPTEKEFLTEIYEHFYKYKIKYATALKKQQERGDKKGYPIPIPVTKVFTTRDELLDDKRIGNKWADVFYEILQPSIFDDTYVQEVKKVGKKYVVDPEGKWMKWKHVKEAFVKEFDKKDNAQATIDEWLGKPSKYKHINIPIARKKFIPSKLYNYWIQARNNRETGHGAPNKLPAERQRRVTSMDSMHSVFKTKYIVEAEEKVMESNIFAHYMRRVVGPVQYIKKMYENSPNALKYITEMTDTVVFKMGRNADYEWTAIIDFLTKSNSLAKIAWAPKVQIFNLAIGQSMDFIREPAAYFRGYRRMISNPRKALNIISQYGVATVIDETKFDELAKINGFSLRWGDNHRKTISIQQWAEMGYIFMDWIEKANQVPIFMGLMTDAEYNSYDDDGNIKDESKYEHLSPFRRDYISDIVNSIHGDYGQFNAAPFWNTNVGRSTAQFKKWLPTMIAEEIAPYHYDSNFLVHSGVVPSMLLMVKLLHHNYLKSEKSRHDKFMKIITTEWPDIEKAKKYKADPSAIAAMERSKKENRERKNYVIKGVNDYLNMLIADRESGKIRFRTDLSKDDLNKMWAGLWQIALAFATYAGIMAAKGSGDDEEKYFQKTATLWYNFLVRYNQDMFMYAQPAQLTNLINSPVAYFDQVVNFTKFVFNSEQYLEGVITNFIDRRKEYGAEVAFENIFWSDKGVYTKDTNLLPEGYPKFMKDFLGFVPMGGLGKNVLQGRLFIQDHRNAVKIMEKRGYPQEMIDASRQVLGDTVLWKDYKQRVLRGPMVKQVIIDSETYDALEEKKIAPYLRDINNYQDELKKRLSELDDYMIYMGFENAVLTHPDSLKIKFEKAQKMKDIENKNKHLPGNKKGEMSEEGIKQLSKPDTTNYEKYSPLKINK